MDRCYRKEPFPNDRARVEHLFTLYEKLTAPLVVEKKKPARTRAVKDPRIPPDWWPGESQDLLYACALRFDGEKLDRELLREGAAAPDGSTYPALKHLYDTHEALSLERLDDVRLIFGVLFLLQRAHKWQDMLNDRDRLLFSWSPSLPVWITPLPRDVRPAASCSRHRKWRERLQGRERGWLRSASRNARRISNGPFFEKRKFFGPRCPPEV